MSKNCFACGKGFTARIQEYGPADTPMCWDCWTAEAKEQEEEWYGLAPHTHDLKRTGSFIGSTVFESLGDPNADGVYILDDGNTIFTPDPEDPCLGTYKQIQGVRP